MKSLFEKWEELFTDYLNDEEMLRIRGGDDGTEVPVDPIIK